MTARTDLVALQGRAARKALLVDELLTDGTGNTDLRSRFFVPAQRTVDSVHPGALASLQ